MDLEQSIEQFRREFYSHLFDVELTLKQKDSNYAELFERKNKILDEYPRLCNVYENQHTNALNETEVGQFLELLKCDMDIKHLEYEEIFYQGMREAYYYFQRMGILDMQVNQ